MKKFLIRAFIISALTSSYPTVYSQIDSTLFKKLLAENIAKKIETEAGPDKIDIIVEKYAEKLGVSNAAIQCPYLYVLIDEWIGTPYKYAGNDKRGVDCSGFVGQILKNFTDAKLPRSAAGMADAVTTKQKKDLKEGDLVFFHLRNIRNKHVGIYLHNGWFVHASTINGVTLNNLNAGTYQHRYSKCGSVRWNLPEQ